MPHSRADSDIWDIPHTEVAKFAQDHTEITLPNSLKLLELIKNLQYDKLPVITKFCNYLPGNAILFFTQLYYEIRDNRCTLQESEIVVIDVLFEEARHWIEPNLLNNYRSYVANFKET